MLTFSRLRQDNPGWHFPIDEAPAVIRSATDPGTLSRFNEALSSRIEIAWIYEGSVVSEIVEWPTHQMDYNNRPLSKRKVKIK
jgi:hypothetical protein